MTRVAVATTSQLAADAASEIASYGGNAVDCALAAAILSMNTEPGVCAMAGSAYVTIWAPGTDPVTIDGNAAIPGLGLHDDERGRGAVSVTMNYGGGITTLVGPGSVAVPGTLAAIERAWQLFGQARWQELFAPAITATRDGFPLSSACHYYLGYSGEMPAGTGLWLNNCLGEIDLNRRGLDATPPGARLPSNMAPSIARHEGTVIAVGSPGADRITTALPVSTVGRVSKSPPIHGAKVHHCR